jgi:hypothetical protein
MTTHNGKIARLPRNIRDELNHRLDEGEPGGRILAWLNALPAVRAAAGGRGINAQNLSNWRQGGYQHWLEQQERRTLVRQLAENAEELAADAGGVEIGNHVSAVLVAEFAASARELLGTITDPAERCVREQEFLHTLARVRRQDNLAGRLAIERERRARERAKEQEKDARRKEYARENWPLIRQIKLSFMADLYASRDFTSQAMATQDAESLLRDVKLDPSGPARSIVPDQA